jgi:hypothetical protein
MKTFKWVVSAVTAIGVLSTGLALAIPSAAYASTTTVPAGMALTVQGETSSANAVFVSLTTHSVTTTASTEIRRIAANLPVAHTRTGTAVFPDRFYFVGKIECNSPLDGSYAVQSRNVLATETGTLSPSLLVEFPAAGTYSCDLSYKILTTAVYDVGTDAMLVGPGGAVVTDTPVITAWASQCNWASIYAGTDPSDCAYGAPGDEGAVAVRFGETSDDRTPIVVEIPSGTTLSVRAAAALSTCGGSGGGADMLLCGDSHASWRSSAARSNIVVRLIGESNPECMPTLATSQRDDGIAYVGIPVKVHHASVYNALLLTTSSAAGCSNAYEISQRITTTSGETVVMHQTGSLLYSY